jgi:cytochrome c oxidase subunit 2
MFFIVGVVIFVSWMMGRCLMHFHESQSPVPDNVIHGTAIEIAWTVTPSLILVLIAVPSFALLYSMDEVVDPAVTLKCIGHQWYWTYEYSDYATADDTSIVYDSYMIPEDDLEAGQLRLLEVDNRVVLPVNTHIRVIITGADVLHSWAVPSLAVKCDGVPGRLNQVSMYIDREGIFYGQCSELCGVNHGFMPIVVEAVSLDDYVAWVAAKLEEV